MPESPLPRAKGALRRFLLLPAAAAGAMLAACTAVVAPASAPMEDVTLPRGAHNAITDPVRAAVHETHYAFAVAPGQFAGRPSAAADAAMRYEFMTAQLLGPYPRREYHPLFPSLLTDGRAELRAALGIAPAAPTQLVVDRLWAASEAMRAADSAAVSAALSGPAFVLPAEQVQRRLAALPPLPRTARGASEAESRFREQDRSGGSDRDRPWR